MAKIPAGYISKTKNNFFLAEITIYTDLNIMVQ